MYFWDMLHESEFFAPLIRAELLFLSFCPFVNSTFRLENGFETWNSQKMGVIFVNSSLRQCCCFKKCGIIKKNDTDRHQPNNKSKTNGGPLP